MDDSQLQFILRWIAAINELMTRVVGDPRVLSGRGVPDALGLFAAVELVGSMGTRCGSAVLIDEDWALTSSHCVSTKALRLSVRATVGGKCQKVKRIWWQTGESFDLQDPSAIWPPSASGMTAGYDQIVILELDEKSKLQAPLYGYAKLPDDLYPEPKDFLLTAGYGEDSDGNFSDKYAYAGVMRYFGERAHWRGGSYLDRDVFLGSMSRKYDSGAPVFLVGVDNSDPFTRLIGIHSCRSLAGPNDLIPPDEQVAEFLPLTGAAQTWIKSKVPSLRLSSVRAPTQYFVLRNSYTCVYLSDANALNNETDSAWCLQDVTSPNGVFDTCDEVDITVKGMNPPTMVIKRGGTIVRQSLTLLPRRLTLGSSQYHCLYAKDPDGDEEFFLFRLNDCNLVSSSGGATLKDPCRRIRIEAFSDGSGSVKPGPTNIQDNTAGAQESTVAALCGWGLDKRGGTGSFGHREYDQDDQGNGYERRR